MARSEPTARPTAQALNAGIDRRSPETSAKPKESWRDTLESIVFAFVLAFLFRTFEAEAFVIPTGSMAPTLYGRHKECQCEKCGFHIVVGASDEVDPDSGYLRWSVDDSGHYQRGPRILSAVCPNCGFENGDLQEQLAFNGDRILVNKYPYEFGDPDRFDVFVFKWPEKPETNYIKRLVGKGGETIRIKQGDLYLWNPDAPVAEQILRKAPEKQHALQIEVYDDAHPPRDLLAAGWPERWHGMQANTHDFGSGDPSKLPEGWQALRDAKSGKLGNWSDSETWKPVDGERAYSLAQGDGLAWLRYRNYAPLPGDWEMLARGETPQPKARLISDFCGYNAYTGEGLGGDSNNVRNIDYGPFWVSDLTVNFDLKIESVADKPEVLLELLDGVNAYRCRIDPASGAATLILGRQVGGAVEETELAQAATSITGPGSYELSFANVDDRLCLWIDGSPVEFGDAAAYLRSGLSNNTPTDNDLTPIGIAVRGAAAQVSNLVVQRDIYYRAQSNSLNTDPFWNALTANLDNPEEWSATYREAPIEFDQLDLTIPPDHYLALGDNSPRSSDSRLWTTQQTVPRDYLVGKAFFTYWPHAVPFLNDGEGYPVWWHKAFSLDRNGERIVTVKEYPKYTLPFYPQVDRMRRIR